ncbi:MAG: translation initiation factor IF-2 [Lachnospiraceae bacterium]|nr:translation initiation factor IF-2 [Lachnospiraceae bacterium]
MAKIRIHALAKELGIQSKDVIGFLAEKNIEVKSVQSSVEGDVIEMVKQRFTKSGAAQGKDETKAETKAAPASEEKTEGKAKAEPERKIEEKPEGKQEMKPEGKTDAKAEGKAGAKPEERPKKKSSITAVFNPQNSKMGGRRSKGQRQSGRSGSDRNHGQRSQNQNQGQGQNQRQNRPEQPVKSASERAEAVKAKFDKILGVDKQTAARQEAEQRAKQEAEQRAKQEAQQKLLAEQKQKEQSLQAAHPEKGENQEKISRSEGNGRPAQTDRSPRQERNDRPARSDRNDRNDRPARADRNDRNDRPARADRNDRNERPVRSDRNDRQGQNRYSNDRGNRNENERNNNRNPQNNRSNNNRPQGDRNNQRVGGNRPKEQRNRFEQEINKMNQNAPAAEEPRKESRDNRRGGNGQKQGRERNSGPRKQERFMNLEKNGGKKKKQQPAPAPVEKEEVIKTITLPESLTIKELAEKMKVQASAIVKKLFLQGTMVTVNQEIDFDKAEEIALEYNCICEMEEKVDVIEELLKEEEEDESKMIKRPPVVCVMGHVDHGKTSLLDAIRNTHVIDREAGGITQHIGAYTVTCNGEKITFLDTPGHEAFTAMRMRGANSTDIAILVVAADDGVMPQTVEAISHAKAAGVEIIVAINKIDKPSANIERVKQELSEYELIPEDWGGSTVFVPVSAHTHEGIDSLLEMILLTAEVMELKANPKRLARGLVIEAQLDKGRGAVATVLVQKGTLKVGQPIAAGSCSGKVRAMIDDKGRKVKEAGPSMPVEILGLNSVPNAGEVFVSTETEKEAKNFADTFISQGREKLLEDTKSRMSLDDLFSQIKSGNVKELGIIVKADVQGSVEAVKQSLLKLSNEEVVVKVIHGGVGAINESDVSLASASNAIIIGFNVRPDAQAKASAEREGVDLRLYKVIYNAIEDVQAAMKGMLDPVFEEKVLGHCEVRQIFKASGVGNIAGSYILDGTFQRGCKVRIFREGEQIFEGNLASLKRFKDDVKEVRAGYECGLVFEGFNDIQELDTVEAYTMVEVPR